MCGLWVWLWLCVCVNEQDVDVIHEKEENKVEGWTKEMNDQYFYTIFFKWLPNKNEISQFVVAPAAAAAVVTVTVYVYI